MRNLRAAALLTAALFTGGVFSAGATAQQRYTPTEYKITLHEVAMSTDGTNWEVAFTSTAGLLIDISDAASFAGIFGNATPIPVGTYTWIRMVISSDLIWSHAAAPVSKTNQTFTVTGGPPGPNPNQMSVHFATHAQGGRPNGPGGGQGTSANPFLLGAQAAIAAGVTTKLRLVFAVSNTLKDQGGGDYDLGPPNMFFVSENGSASSLTGTFNTVLYNSVKEFASDNTTVDSWSYMSGNGVLTFDGAGSWTWAGTENNFNVLTGSGALNGSASHAGLYGVNTDGSFWMTANGEPGTLRGAIAADGKMIVATMYDSASSHMMIFGTQRATAASAANMNSGYYFTTYGSAYKTGPIRLEYNGCFGIVTGNGTGAVTGTQDCNEVTVTNPNGSRTYIGPTATLADPFNDTLTVNANGTLSTTELAGGMLENGDAACVGWDFNGTYNPSHKFGFLVKQSVSGTFTAASLNGTYFGGHFGDVYETSPTSHCFFSGFFKIVFDGAGSATVTTLENREGAVTVTTFPQLYTVDTATGIVTFRETNGNTADLKGAIGPGAGSFILSSQQQVENTASDQRFLGLGLKQ